MTRRTLALAAALAATSLIGPTFGCGGSGGTAVSTVPVNGKVTFKGKPLTKGKIQFESDLSGLEAFGEIQPDGTYSIMTRGREPGAVLGKHRVAISYGEKSLPAKYASLATSKIEVEVVEGKADYPIDLK